MNPAQKQILDIATKVLGPCSVKLEEGTLVIDEYEEKLERKWKEESFRS